MGDITTLLTARLRRPNGRCRTRDGLLYALGLWRDLMSIRRSPAAFASRATSPLALLQSPARNVA